MLSAMIKKEFLLVFRDRHALLALFVMPAIFILIMSVAMKNQFSTSEVEFSLYVKSIENTQASQELISKIKEDKNLLLVEKKGKCTVYTRYSKRVLCKLNHYVKYNR